MIRHVIAEAFNALSHYKLRSALTMLSVTWGVASLILLLSYGQGFGLALTQAFDQIGKNLVVVFPGQTSLQAGGERSGRRIALEIGDVQALKNGVPTIEEISPEVRRYLPINFGYRTRDYTVAGVYHSFQRIRHMEVETGRYLSEDDVQQRRRVVVIGADLKKQIFSGLPAVDKEVKISGIRFTVVGVLKKKTQISNYSAPDDVTAMIPFTTMATMVNARYLNNIVVLPVNNGFRDRIVADLRAALAREHNFNARDERALTILDWNQFRSLVTNLSMGLQILLTIIGTLTLGIGAVGVMNIMLVSVTERTREIGVLKALGAHSLHILGQILAEGLALTIGGGILGYLLATIIVRTIGSLPLLGPLFEDTSGQSDIHLSVSLSALLVSSLVLIVVGMAAGLLPAIRAARLDPAIAIRNE
jgi:putative ABC transport system permease protein